jgi:hypothetical protein
MLKPFIASGGNPYGRHLPHHARPHCFPRTMSVMLKLEAKVRARWCDRHVHGNAGCSEATKGSQHELRFYLRVDAVINVVLPQYGAGYLFCCPRFIQRGIHVGASGLSPYSKQTTVCQVLLLPPLTGSSNHLRDCVISVFNHHPENLVRVVPNPPVSSSP